MTAGHDLPTRATFAAIMRLLLLLRENNSEAFVSSKVKEYSDCRAVLMQLNLARRSGGRLVLTPEGEKLAWASKKERESLVRRHIVFQYRPYSAVLSRHRKEWKSSLETAAVVSTWARMGYPWSPKTLVRGANLLFQIMEAGGLGLYRKGRSGKPTRIVFGPAAQRHIEEGLDARGSEPRVVATPPKVAKQPTPVAIPTDYKISSTGLFELTIHRPEGWDALMLFLKKRDVPGA